MFQNYRFKGPKDCCKSLPKCDFDQRKGWKTLGECAKACLQKRDDPCCWKNCILQKKGLVDANGKFNKEMAMKSLMDKTTNPDAWKPVFESAVEKCESEGKN